MTGDRWGHSGSREREARRSGAIGKKIRLAALALTRAAEPKPDQAKATVIPFPWHLVTAAGSRPPKKALKLRFRRPRRRRFYQNEPIRPAIRRDYMERWELYEWHERQGTLALYFMMFPEP